ncbi:hypothetical protein [Clostridium kluyveri]|uniref:Phage related protein n=2 Tax=Clostridium kluyveri TaxID=1534 RepID=A5F9N2_CLOK5|nr:hypothetical protein [Clostridium kluyveri]ABQ23622.1 phage related protein [Clostridium kluyveri DSM 555]
MNQKATIKNLRQKVLDLQIENKGLNEGCGEFAKAVVDLAKNLGRALSVQIDYEEILHHMFGIEIISSKEAEEIIEKSVPKGKFLEFTENGYLGIDNTSGDVWTEDFDTLAKCVKWLQGEDLEEIEKVKHISRNCGKLDLKCDYCRDGKCESKKLRICVFRKVEDWRAKEVESCNGI